MAGGRKPDGGGDPDDRRAHRQYRQQPGDAAQQHGARNAGQAQSKGGQQALHDGGTENAIHHPTHRVAGDQNQPLGAVAGNTFQQKLDAARHRFAVQIDKEGGEQRQQEHEHAAGDTQQDMKSVFEHDAEIGLHRAEHGTDVFGPVVPKIAHGLTDQRNVEQPRGGGRQTGAQRFFHDTLQPGNIVAAARRGQTDRQHDHDRGQCDHDAGGRSVPQMQPLAQPLERRPSGEHQDCSPEQRGNKRVQNQHAADRHAPQQQPHQDPFGRHVVVTSPPCTAVSGKAVWWLVASARALREGPSCHALPPICR